MPILGRRPLGVKRPPLGTSGRNACERGISFRLVHTRTVRRRRSCPGAAEKQNVAIGILELEPTPTALSMIIAPPLPHDAEKGIVGRPLERDLESRPIAIERERCHCILHDEEWKGAPGYDRRHRRLHRSRRRLKMCGIPFLCRAAFLPTPRDPSMRISLSIAVASALAAGPLHAQTPARPTPEQLEASYLAHRGDFDYLLGDWRFTAESGEWGRFEGYWSAVRLATGAGTHILDEYRIIGDSGETHFASSTLRAYNPHRDRWELVSVGDGDGLQDIGTARKVGDEMHIEQTFGGAGGEPELWRIRYYDIRSDRFSWVADRSLDGGRTWVPNHLRIEARRIGPARDLPSLVVVPPPAGTGRPGRLPR